MSDQTTPADQFPDTRKMVSQSARPDGPAVPKGREPASVVGEPSDEELLELTEDWPATSGPRHDLSGCPEVLLYSVFADEVVEFARAVLSRWGRQPAPPAAGEVGELVAELRMVASHAAEACQFTDAESLSRAADLLEQRHPAPVPVSERLPGPGDCDGEGRCWWGFEETDDYEASWTLRKMIGLPFDDTHWLPAHALPLPAGEVE